MGEVAVVGAGVFGLACAVTLRRAGLAVRLIDPGDPAPSASAVAAGMLAPVAEAEAEGASPDVFALLAHARDLWPDFAAATPGLTSRLDRTPARLLDPAASARLPDPHAGPVHRDGARLLQGDWRIDVHGALQDLQAEVDRLGVIRVAGRVSAAEGGRLKLGGAPLQEPFCVLAAGSGARSLAAAAPELALLTPVKGQILIFDGAGTDGPVLRRGERYVVPQPAGARAGATMEPGRDDLDVDPQALAALHADAGAIRPDLADAAFRGAAGVRMETPDGLPLAGPSLASGVILAAGARRNGWLLAPLVAQIVTAHVTGTSAGPYAGRFHPGRFAR